MKKFRFNLESVLKIKGQEKNIKREELTKEINKLRESQDMLSNIIQEIYRYSDFCIKIGENVITVWNYKFYKNYLINLNAIKVDLDRKKAEQEKIVRKKQEEYLRLKRTVDALEKMKAAKLQQYISELQKEDYTLMDNLALTNHFRQVGSNDREG